MGTQQPLLGDEHQSRTTKALLDQLLTDSRLYRQTRDYKELLNFVVRLRNFAPFNAMLLQTQKPGLSYAASACDWRERFGRFVKDGARPLVILWPMGPVAFVYDVMDTEGDPLPEDVACFFAVGNIDAAKIASFIPLMRSKRIECVFVDGGDRHAGSIEASERTFKGKERRHYTVHINRNHDGNVQFASIAHELGHLFLGHLGLDEVLSVPERRWPVHAQRELEAESVAFLVCARNGVASKSHNYLADYVKHNTTVDQLDVYQVMRAAGQVESLLGLTWPTKF